MGYDVSNAHVAQLVEHVLGKDEVTRSIRVVGSMPCLTRPGVNALWANGSTPRVCGLLDLNKLARATAFRMDGGEGCWRRF
jgi:hypothetical protein